MECGQGRGLLCGMGTELGVRGRSKGRQRGRVEYGWKSLTGPKDALMRPPGDVLMACRSPLSVPFPAKAW